MEYPCHAIKTDPEVTNSWQFYFSLIITLNIKQFYSMVTKVSFETKQAITDKNVF